MMRVIVGIPPSSVARPDHGLQKQPAPEDLQWEKLSTEELLAMASTQSLLGDARSFRMEGALTGSRSDEFLALGKELVASPHQFIFTEEKLLKKATDALAKAGAELVIHPPVKKEEGFAMFSVTYVFAARDRKKLWLLLNAALRSGAVPEAVAGMLHWKVRDMLAKQEQRHYSRAELARISRELVTLYHDSHRGAGDLGLLLERFVLGL
jgi:hypothetical protein